MQRLPKFSNKLVLITHTERTTRELLLALTCHQLRYVFIFRKTEWSEGQLEFVWVFASFLGVSFSIGVLKKRFKNVFTVVFFSKLKISGGGRLDGLSRVVFFSGS